VIRWTESEAKRLHPQEQALLALCDRLTVLEQAFTAEVEAHSMTRKRLDHIQTAHRQEVASLCGSLNQLRGQLRSLLDMMEREE
jgi:predicted ATP-dependent serine protease